MGQSSPQARCSWQSQLQELVSILLRKIRYESSSTREEFVCFGENRRRDDTTEVILYEYDLDLSSHDDTSSDSGVYFNQKAGDVVGLDLCSRPGVCTKFSIVLLNLLGVRSTSTWYSSSYYYRTQYL